MSTEKSRIGYELVKTKQDIAAIINEVGNRQYLQINIFKNMLLKKINREAIATINSLEAKINEVNLQNQALLSQVLKFKSVFIPC